MDIWKILIIMKQKLKSWPPPPPTLNSFHTKMHHHSLLLPLARERYSQVRDYPSQHTLRRHSCLCLSSPYLTVIRQGEKKSKSQGKRKKGKHSNLNSSVCKPLNCDKYLDLSADYWPPCKTPVSIVYWKSVARLPLIIRLLGFAAGVPPPYKDKKRSIVWKSIAVNNKKWIRL